MRRWLSRGGKYMFFAIAVVAALAADITYRSLAYWQGYKMFEAPPILLFMLGSFWTVAACSLLALASAIFLLKHAVSAVPRRLVGFAPFLVVIVLFVALWTNTRHRDYYVLRGMRDWVSERPDMVREVEEWFRTVEKDKSLSKTKGYLIDPDLPPGEQRIKAEWPPCVKRLNPTCVALAYVRGAWQGDVVCGGGFLCWGLVTYDRHDVVANELFGYMMKVGPTSYVYVEAPEKRLFDD